MNEALAIRPEASADRRAIRAIVETAFGGQAEADLLDSFRAMDDLVLSLVGVDGDPIGVVTFSRVGLPGSPHLKACALAPLAVLPSRQRQGVGAALVRDGLGRLRSAGVDIVLVLGEPAYYSRFGFSPDTARHVITPYDGPFLQALCLSAGGAGAKGPAVYARAFADLV
jgi:putative acetyltransferase